MFTAALSKNWTVNNKDFKIKTKEPLQYSNLTFKNKDLKRHELRIPFHLSTLYSWVIMRTDCNAISLMFQNATSSFNRTCWKQHVSSPRLLIHILVARLQLAHQWRINLFITQQSTWKTQSTKKVSGGKWSAASACTDCRFPRSFQMKSNLPVFTGTILATSQPPCSYVTFT